MLKKESNQLVAITNISESLNKQCVIQQQRAQTKASAPLKIPLGSTHVTTTVNNNDVCYSVTVLQHNFACHITFHFSKK